MCNPWQTPFMSHWLSRANRVATMVTPASRTVKGEAAQKTGRSK